MTTRTNYTFLFHFVDGRESIETSADLTSIDFAAEHALAVLNSNPEMSNCSVYPTESGINGRRVYRDYHDYAHLYHS